MVLGMCVVVVVQQGAPVTCDATEELHLSSQRIQLTPELPILLLEMSHGSSEGPTQVGRLLQTTLHTQFKSTHIHMDLPDGIP